MTLARVSGRHLQVSNSSSIIFLFVFFQRSLLTSSLHSLNQSAMLLTSPYLGLDSCSQIRRKGQGSAQPRCWWWLTRFMCPSSAKASDSSLKPALSLPPTLPPSPLNAESAGLWVTLLLYAKKRHKPPRSPLSSTTVLPTDVLTKAAGNVFPVF